MSTTAKCQTCGKTFVPCASCAKKNGSLQWRAVCDSPECFQIYCVALDYRDGKITKQELKDKFSQFDLERILAEDNAVKKIITDAMTEDLSTRSRRRLALIDSESQDSKSLEE